MTRRSRRSRDSASAGKVQLQDFRLAGADGRCLGAAVIMQWNTIPTKLQRELFDTAGSLGDVLKSAALRGQIARFLHDHKDEENLADSSSKSNMTEGKPERA